MLSKKILKMNVSICTPNIIVDKVKFYISSNTSAYICVSNVHMCMEVFDSAEFAHVVNSSDLVIPDGKPLVWAQKLLGYRNAQQVRGQDITNALCAVSGSQKIKIGLYGGSSQDLLDKVVIKLKQQYPDLEVTFTYSPPFRPLTDLEDASLISDINAAEVDVLFVGIGCPKQERWMADHKGKINCVMLGVGAVFDFIAGSKKHAPRWVQKIGMEWFFRLCSEPKRLWRRYLTTNPRFIWHFGKQLIKHKFKSK